MKIYFYKTIYRFYRVIRMFDLKNQYIPNSYSEIKKCNALVNTIVHFNGHYFARRDKRPAAVRSERDSKSVCRPWIGPLHARKRGGAATSSSLHLRAASRRATNDRPPRAGERFYIRVEFALPNRYKSKYRVVGRSSRWSCTRSACTDFSRAHSGCVRACLGP